MASGAEVAIGARTKPADDELPHSHGRSASFVEADVRDAEQARSLVESVVDRYGRIDVLVNNAGGSPAAAAAEASPRFVTSVVALNLLAPFFCAQAANTFMQRQEGGGSIINISSVSGLRPSPGTAAYGAAKAGLISLTRSLAVEWAPSVRVNCVVAGLLKTEAADLHYGGAEGISAVAATVPLKRLGTPREVAAVCLFLASPLSSYVSGAAIEVHGGGEPPVYLAALGQI
jgi:NAD(P)-dependent dehydrogenase (short-subunit alcohol dehydrogenase family)